MHWRTRAGDEITATLGTPMTKDQIAQAWRTALDPSRRLDPAGARGRRQAADRGPAGDAGRRRPGHRERPRDRAGVRRAAAADQRRAAGRGAVRRPDGVQEDRHVRRLRPPAGWSRCGWCPRAWTCPGWPLGCTRRSVSTALFFAQAVGRFVRVRQRGETASVFVPSVPVLLGFAAELEAERDHVVRALDRDPEAELEEASGSGRRRTTSRYGPAFEALKASATFDRVLFDGGEFGTATEAGSPEEDDYLGLPGLLDPDQVAVLLRKRQAAQLATRSAARRQRRRRRGSGAVDARAAAGSGPRRRPTATAPPVTADRQPRASWPSSARSSTAWSARGVTAPASRTASSTTSSARPAAARRSRRRRPSRSRPASRRSASGRCPAVNAAGRTAVERARGALIQSENTRGRRRGVRMYQTVEALARGRSAWLYTKELSHDR